MPVVSTVVRAGEHSFKGMYMLSGTQPQPQYQFHGIWKGKRKAPAFSHFVRQFAFVTSSSIFGSTSPERGSVKEGRGS